MPQVIVSESARQDLQRLQQFLKTKNILAAQKAADVIIRGFRQLATLLNIGRPVAHLPLEYQELVLEFGSSGYVMLYRFDDLTDSVVVLNIRHQKEAGYQTL